MQVRLAGCKDKVVQNAQSAPAPPAASPRGPEVIFANWREMLHQLKLAMPLRNTYAQAIEGYLDYCLHNGLNVGVESARGFVSDARRRGLTQEGAAWEAALKRA